ncbi:MAG: hypothetical protein U0W40_11300 [Acidimicrobiia bacterium]
MLCTVGVVVMRVRCVVVVALLAFAAVAADVLPAGAASVGQCAVYSPTGFCVDWGTANPGTPSPHGPSGDPSQGVSCWWQDISGFDSSPDSLANFGLTAPPPGVQVVWQTLVCSDGTSRYEFRWIVPVTPANLAATAFGRLEGELPAPLVVSDPALGTASVVGVPVFVAVANWTDVVTESECAAGMCVTVQATPSLTFDPGEPGATPRACAGSGSRYAPGAGAPAAQAAVPGACAYAYLLRTAVGGRPDVWTGSVSVTWSIGWVASTGEMGVLPSVTRSTSTPRAVQEVQTVIVGGG